MTASIRVIILGALGRMGREVVNALLNTPDILVVCAVDIAATNDKLAIGSGNVYKNIPLFKDVDIASKTCQADVLIDFSIASATKKAIQIVSPHGLNIVTGTSGLKQNDLVEIEAIAKQYNNCIIAIPNFAIGAVVMMHLAKIAAKYFDTAEIIEMHHDQKADSPSGTAIATARIMAESKQGDFKRADTQVENIIGCRGGESAGITIHSVRLPGLMAHQEIIFGLSGQTLIIRHDTLGRECYIPGILLAIREATKRKGFYHGLEKLLGL